MGKNSGPKNKSVSVKVQAKRNVKALADQLKECKSFVEFVSLDSIQELFCDLDIDNSQSNRNDNEGESCWNRSSPPSSTNKDKQGPESDTFVHKNNPSSEKEMGSIAKVRRGPAKQQQQPEHEALEDDGESEPVIIRKEDNDDKKSLIKRVSDWSKKIANFNHVSRRFLPNVRKWSASNYFGAFFSILAFIFYFELHTPPGFTRMWLRWGNVDLQSVECTIESPHLAMELFRPPVTCDICHNVSSVDRIQAVSPKDFERIYAYSGRPVVITDGMTNWTARESFSFEFFKSIYEEGSRSLEHLGEDCLFFPYATEFRSLGEVFNMSEKRQELPWYIGWSNCDAETSHILRLHYQRPYFLPETAESTHADWIFMGTPGHGAHMHVDHVINPSWQAQIKGKKRWFLQPSPECFYECPSLVVDVHPGDIIVLDTNKWYHQTQILSGEVSITIGSEYD